MSDRITAHQPSAIRILNSKFHSFRVFRVFRGSHFCAMSQPPKPTVTNYREFKDYPKIVAAASVSPAAANRRSRKPGRGTSWSSENAIPSQLPRRIPFSLGIRVAPRRRFATAMPASFTPLEVLVREFLKCLAWRMQSATTDQSSASLGCSGASDKSPWTPRVTMSRVASSR